MEIPGVFWSAAIKLTTNSGKEVPKETIVRPIITGLTPMERARAEEYRIKSSAPPHRKNKPTMRRENCKII
jgi:hypothetical protein